MNQPDEKAFEEAIISASLAAVREACRSEGSSSVQAIRQVIDTPATQPFLFPNKKEQRAYGNLEKENDVMKNPFRNVSEK